MARRKAGPWSSHALDRASVLLARPWASQLGIDDESDQVTEGYLVDALALRGDEGRGTLR